MKRYRSILGIALAAVLAACSHEGNPGAYPTEGQSYGCPLARLQGVTATVADIPDGVAVTFYAPSDEVVQLRQIAYRMADDGNRQNNAFAACPCGIGNRAIGNAERMAPDMTSGAADDFAVPSESPPADARVYWTTTGAMLELKARDQAQIDALRSATRTHVRWLRRECLGQRVGLACSSKGEPS